MYSATVLVLTAKMTLITKTTCAIKKKGFDQTTDQIHSLHCVGGLQIDVAAVAFTAPQRAGRAYVRSDSGILTQKEVDLMQREKKVKKHSELNVVCCCWEWMDPLAFWGRRKRPPSRSCRE